VAKHLARVVDILSQISAMHVAMITPRTKLVRDLGMDSLDLAEVEHELSNEFDVNFDCGRVGDISVEQILNQLDALTE
jgi:acyl carrier protein